MDQRVIEGVEASFQVAAHSTAPMQFQWHKNGVPLSGEQSDRLAMASARPEDAGEYQVLAVNSAGAMASQVARLTVLSPPAISEPPQNLEITEGETLTLAVRAHGTEPFAYQWFKDGQEIFGPSHPALSLPAATAESAGIYAVRISNEAGLVTSGPAIVSVLTSPRIMVQPQSATLTAPWPSPFTLEAKVSGSQPFTYQWLKDGETVEGAHGPDLKFPAISASDEGRYTLQVANRLGSVLSDPAEITVLTGPRFMVRPASATVVDGSRLILSALATGSSPLSYRWLRDGAAIPGAANPELVFEGITGEDAGNYSIVVENPAGRISEEARVVVQCAPKITAQSQSQNVSEGGTVNLFLQAASSSPLSYQWLKDGSPLIDATTARIIISGAASSDSGIYSALVWNAIGTNVTQAIHVSVGGSQSALALNLVPEQRLSIKSAPGRFSLSSSGAPGETFVVETSRTLGSSSWLLIGTGRVNADGILEFPIGSEFLQPPVFFRVRKE